MVYYKNELYHHGILGQKWGVRRYQNKDGSYTSAGKERRKEEWPSSKKNTAAKIGKGIAIAATVGLSAYLLSKNSDAAKEIIKRVGKSTVNSLSESSKRVGKTMLDAALMSVGTVAINKLAEKMPTDDSVDENTRIKNQIMYDTISSGIKEATKANSSTNKSNNGGNVGKEIGDKLGSPTNKGIDKQSSAYQSLFKDSNGNQRDSDVRATIKSLASAGYDIDQLRLYVQGVDNGTIKHSFIDAGYYAVIALLNKDNYS